MPEVERAPRQITPEERVSELISDLRIRQEEDPNRNICYFANNPSYISYITMHYALEGMLLEVTSWPDNFIIENVPEDEFPEKTVSIRMNPLNRTYAYKVFKDKFEGEKAIKELEEHIDDIFPDFSPRPAPGETRTPRIH